jgi:hypothetical protein
MTYDHKESAEGVIEDLRYGRASNESEHRGWQAICQAEATLALADAVDRQTELLRLQHENVGVCQHGNTGVCMTCITHSMSDIAEWWKR